MKKLTKTQVKALLKKLNNQETTEIFLLPSKTHLSGFKCWIEPYEVNLSNDLDQFEKIINEFSYYNCNNETGNSVHYYIKEK